MCVVNRAERVFCACAKTNPGRSSRRRRLYAEGALSVLLIAGFRRQLISKSCLVVRSSAARGVSVTKQKFYITLIVAAGTLATDAVAHAQGQNPQEQKVLASNSEIGRAH